MYIYMYIYICIHIYIYIKKPSHRLWRCHAVKSVQVMSPRRRGWRGGAHRVLPLRVGRALPIRNLTDDFQFASRQNFARKWRR